MQAIQQTINDVHVLGAAPVFEHPLTGTVYWAVCEKVGDGVKQNLVIYRRKEGQTTFEHVHTFVGGVDAASQITMGGAIIRRDGSLEVGASGTPLGGIDKSGTGLSALWAVIPGKDEPWVFTTTTQAGGAQAGTDPRVAGLLQRVTALEQQLAAAVKQAAALQQRAANLEARPVAQTRDSIWAWMGDRVYADVSNDGNVRNVITALVKKVLAERKS